MEALPLDSVGLDWLGFCRLVDLLYGEFVGFRIGESVSGEGLCYPVWTFCCGDGDGHAKGGELGSLGGHGFSVCQELMRW